MKACLDWDLLATAPQGVEHLRRLLVQLAVEGRLVAGRPDESSADHLLARLQVARDAHYSTSAQRPTKQVGEAALAPFDLPSHWRWTSLGQLAHPQAGFAFKSSGFNEAGQGLPLIRIRDVGQPFSGTYYSGEYRDEFLVRSGDYLISMDGEFRVAEWTHDEALLNQRVTRLQFFEGSVNRRFIAMSLQCRLHELQGVKTYTTVDHLSGGQIATAPIGLPPLEEQHRIVAKTDELMALCDRLEARQKDAEVAHARLVQALLDSLTQAGDVEEFKVRWQRVAGLFESLLTTTESVDCLLRSCIQWALAGRFATHLPSDEPAVSFVRRAALARREALGARGRKISDAASEAAPVDRIATGLPENWCRCRVDEITECLDYLRRPINKAEREGRVGTVPYYGANGQVGWIDEHLFDEDLVLVVEDETFIGRTKPFSYVVQGKSWVNNHAHILRPLAGMSAQYLNLCLHRYDFIPLTSGTTGRRKLTQAGLNAAEIAIAPLAEQARITAKVADFVALCDQLKARIAAARAKHAQLAEALVAQAVAA